MRGDELVKDSEGNEDVQSPRGHGRSAAGGVRPVRITAALGLGENVPSAASCLSPRMNDEEIEMAQDLAWAIATADSRMVERGYPVADIVEEDE